jgi:hypothetical protein
MCMACTRISNQDEMIIIIREPLNNSVRSSFLKKKEN